MQSLKDAIAAALPLRAAGQQQAKTRPMTGPEHREARRASERAHIRRMRRFNQTRATAGQLRAAAERLSTSQARVLAGEIGTPAMRRNVYVAVRNQVREEVAKELQPETRIELEVETDRRLEAAGIPAVSA